MMLKRAEPTKQKIDDQLHKASSDEKEIGKAIIFGRTMKGCTNFEMHNPMNYTLKEFFF